MMRTTCPECGSPLAASREVSYADVALNREGEMVMGREIGQSWRLFCEQGHGLEVVESATDASGDQVKVIVIPQPEQSTIL